MTLSTALLFLALAGAPKPSAWRVTYTSSAPFGASGETRMFWNEKELERFRDDRDLIYCRVLPLYTIEEAK